MKAKNKRGSDVENKDMSIELPSLHFINLLTPLHRNKEIILGLVKSCTKLLQKPHSTGRSARCFVTTWRGGIGRVGGRETQEGRDMGTYV